MSSSKRLLIAVLMLTGAAMAQKDKPKPKDELVPLSAATTSVMSIVANPPQASYTEKITKDGHYLVTFDDPNRDFTCNITSTSPENRWYISTLTIVCVRVHTITDEREVKP